MKKLFIIFAAVATLVACGNKKAANTSTECAAETIEVATLAPAELAGEWTIAKVSETAIADSVETLLAFNDSLQMYSAYVGCNRINGTWLHTDSLVLTDGLSTKMLCEEGIDALEQALCVALPQVKQAVTCKCGGVALQNATGETLVVIRK